MSKIKILNSDSIAELAEFWDNHDLIDFEDQLEEVTEPIFERKNVIQISLATKKMTAVQNIARS